MRQSLGRRRLCTAPFLEVRDVAGRGRGVVATARIEAGAVLHRASPMSHVVKQRPEGGPSLCRHCCAPLPSAATPFCSRACEGAFDARGGAILSRVDLGALHALHAEQGRKFPLHVASLLAALLAELRAGRVPARWAPLELCYAELEPEALAQTDGEHAALVDAFVGAGVTTRETLDLLLPASRYRRLLGAAQLNAFELKLSHGAVLSALLPGTASAFNHSCAPSVLLACGETHEVAFVAGEPIEAGDEALISYVDCEAPDAERQHTLLYKYGFACDCPRCAERRQAT